MKRNNHFITLATICVVMTLGLDSTLAAAPPNPTNSDDRSNTAGGRNVLQYNTGEGNTGFGADAFYRNTSGSWNTAFGTWTFLNNTRGKQNTAIGGQALNSNSTGSNNTAIGYLSLVGNLTGNNNTATGYGSLSNTSSGVANGNTADGALALNGLFGGNYNTAVGVSTLSNLALNGSNNTAVGGFALRSSVGNGNTALGFNAGSKSEFGSNNIYISNYGQIFDESTIRIGQIQSRTFIAGIRGRSTGIANAVPVVIDSKGQLGTINSSARFKKDIQDMNDASRRLLQLRPVTYHYKQADGSGANPLEYGLIAEEVAKVYPDLVAYGEDGKIETVQYQKLTPMLLNELQRTNSQLKADEVKLQQQAEEIAQLKKQTQEVTYLKQQVNALSKQAHFIESLSARLTKIEAQKMVGFNR